GAGGGVCWGSGGGGGGVLSGPARPPPPLADAVYQALNAPVRLSCQASGKSPGAGPLASCGKLLSPRELTSTGVVQVTPSVEVAAYRLFGPPAAVLNVYATTTCPAESAATDGVAS